MNQLVMEFVGTFFLVLAIGLSGNPLAIGLTLAAMIYVGGHVSGAHYNPAVTLAVFLRGKAEAKDIVPYFALQILGALAAAAVHFFLKGETFAPAPGEGVSFVQALTAETLFTFVLASVVLNVATTKALDGNYVYGFATGLTVTAAALCAGAISGGAFNPAVGTGPILFDTLQGGSSIANLALYWIGPLLGGGLAAALFKFLQPEE